MDAEDLYRPSFFELVAQDQLRELLQPVFRYILAVFAQRNPRFLLRIFNNQDECFALLMFLVERHYLCTSSASFTESFYDLKRRKRPVLSNDRARAAMSLFQNRESLSRTDINLSLFFLVGLPYLQAKARNYYEHLGGGLESDELFTDQQQQEQQQSEQRQLDPSSSSSTQSLKEHSKHFYKKSYPYLSAAWQFWMASYNIRYLFDKTPYYRPWLAFMRTDVRRMSMEDHRKAAESSMEALQAPFARDPQTGATASLPTILFRLANQTPRLLLDSLRILLPTSIFLVKFLEWWYSTDRPGASRRTQNTEREIAPPLKPPSKLEPHPDGVLKPSNGGLTPKGVCPLCREKLTNATALHTGWVYDYKCAWQWVVEKETCPVTLLPSSTAQLRKVVG